MDNGIGLPKNIVRVKCYNSKAKATGYVLSAGMLRITLVVAVGVKRRR